MYDVDFRAIIAYYRKIWNKSKQHKILSSGMHIKQKRLHYYSNLKSDRDRIQTCNLLIRSQMLYSVELRGRHPSR